MMPRRESPLREQAAEMLRQARATPRGALRNDFRHLATALLGLDRQQHAFKRETTRRLAELQASDERSA